MRTVRENIGHGFVSHTEREIRFSDLEICRNMYNTTTTNSSNNNKCV